MLRRAAKLSLLNFLSLFRDLQKPTRFSRGGGVVAECFQWGVVAQFVAKSNVYPTFSDIRG